MTAAAHAELTLAEQLESGPGSRELSDKVLLAMGWQIIKQGADQRSWRWQFGSIEMSGFSRPDPTRSVDDALARVRQIMKDRTFTMRIDFRRMREADWVDVEITVPSREFQGRAMGNDDALPRAICLAAWRAKKAGR